MLNYKVNKLNFRFCKLNLISKDNLYPYEPSKKIKKKQDDEVMIIEVPPLYLENPRPNKLKMLPVEKLFW